MKQIKTITIAMTFVILVLARQNAYCEETVNTNTSPILMQYKYAPGEITRYLITQKLTGMRTMPGTESPVIINAELAATLKLECSRIWDDGTIELLVSTETASLKIDGKAVEDYQPSKDTFTVPFSPSGVSGLVNLDFGSLESMLFMTILSQKPVNTGDSWVMNIPLPKSWPSVVKMTYTLKGINKTDNSLIASIKQVITTTTGLKSGEKVQSSGNLQEGSSDMQFDITTGKLISAKGLVHSVVLTLIGTNTLNSKSNPRDNISKTTLDNIFTVDILKETKKADSTETK